MAHLAAPRIGWENEHLATFLLSRISFVANPITVADDIGSDFFCTLFESRIKNTAEQLFPRNSFAIQIKSSDTVIPATNKIEYLDTLELPFFVGVVDRAHLNLRIYSGEYIPLLLTQYEIPRELKLLPTSAEEIETKSYCDVTQDHKLVALSALLRLPFVAEICAQDSRVNILNKAQRLGELCSRMHMNISAKASREYIFRLEQPNTAVIMAGEGSAKTFRQNFYLRLTEAFYNLEWIHKAQRHDFKMEEFKVYENCYLGLIEAGLEIPTILQGIYNKLKQQLAGENSG